MAWFRENYHNSCAIEIKASKPNGKSIAETALLDHQRAALLDAAGGYGVVHKLSDEARRQQPFDAFKLYFAQGLVVACFDGECQVFHIKRWRGARRDGSIACAFSFKV